MFLCARICLLYTSLLALKSARKGEFEKAKEQLKQVSQSMILAHNVQTRLIQKEMTGEKHQVSLLMVHAQDHLMTAMAIRDMVEEDVYKRQLMMKKKVTKNRRKQ